MRNNVRRRKHHPTIKSTVIYNYKIHNQTTTMKRKLCKKGSCERAASYSDKVIVRKTTCTAFIISVLSFCNPSVVLSFSSPLPQLKSSSTAYRGNINDSYNVQNYGHFTRSKQTTSTTSCLRAKKKRPIPIVGYNAEEICDYYDRRPLVVGWRLNKLSLPLLGK